MKAQSRDPFNLAHSATLAELHHSWSRFDAEARVAQRMLAGIRITTMPSKLLAEVAFAQGRYSDVTSLVACVSNYLDVLTQIVIGDRLRALDNLADFRRTHPDFPLWPETRRGHLNT